MRVSDPLREGCVYSFYHVLWRERVPPGLYVLIMVAHNEVGSMVAIRSLDVDIHGEARWGMFFNPPKYKIKQTKKGACGRCCSSADINESEDDLPALDEPWAPPPLPPLDACIESASLRLYALREAVYDRIDILVAN